jgi:signal transduction histidine kinase
MSIVTYVTPGDPGEGFGPEITAALDTLRDSIGDSLELDGVMERVWEISKSVLPHDRVGLSFIDADGERVKAHYYKADYTDISLGDGYSDGLAGSSLQAIVEQKKARLIHDLEEYAKVNPQSASTRLLLAEGVRSNLTLPLNVEGREIGFLFFSSRRPNAFTEVHARVLLDVSRIISQTVEKVWRIRQLQERTNDYLSVLGFVSHEIKSPLASLITVGKTYLKGYMGDVDPTAEKTMGKMVRTAGYLVNMVNNYLDLSRLESGEMKFEPKEGVAFMDDVVSFAVDTVTARAEERGSRVDIRAEVDGIELFGDMDLLRIVAVNLLDNGVKYGFDNSTVQARVAIEDGQLVFSVRNPGVGFTKEQARKLFQRFSRLKQKGTEDRRGTGLGLYLTWWIVQKHGGRITADSEPGEWAEFTVRLPLKKKD